MLAQIQPGEIPKTLKVKEPPLGIDTFGLVDGNGDVDNGLGFGQGSTAGVLGARYPKMKRVSESCGGCSDISRPSVPETDCRLRQIFNLHRLCTSAYANHYDPGTDACRADWRRENQRCAVVPLSTEVLTPKKKTLAMFMPMLLVVCVIIYFFIRRR